MGNLLKIVEISSSAVISIDADKLKVFTAKVKIWDFASLSLNDYQKFSEEDCSSVLQKYYVDCADINLRFQVYFHYCLI